MSDLMKAVQQVRDARMELWGRMAANLPNRHILAVEMFRTEDNHTLAVFTLVRNHRVVQEVVRGNSRGLDVKAVVPHHHHCEPVQVWPEFHVEAMRLELAPDDAPPPPPPDGEDDEGDGGVDLNTIALGVPPPKQPPEPGIISTGTAILPTVFDLGERAT